jgi:hypothetical protein
MARYRDKRGRFLSAKKVKQLARRRALYALKKAQKAARSVAAARRKEARGFGQAVARTRVKQIEQEQKRAREPVELVEYEIEIAIDYGED